MATMVKEATMLLRLKSCLFLLLSLTAFSYTVESLPFNRKGLSSLNISHEILNARKKSNCTFPPEGLVYGDTPSSVQSKTSQPLNLCIPGEANDDFFAQGCQWLYNVTLEVCKQGKTNIQLFTLQDVQSQSSSVCNGIKDVSPTKYDTDVVKSILNPSSCQFVCDTDDKKVFCYVMLRSRQYLVETLGSSGTVNGGGESQSQATNTAAKESSNINIPPGNLSAIPKINNIDKGSMGQPADSLQALGLKFKMKSDELATEHTKSVAITVASAKQPQNNQAQPPPVMDANQNNYKTKADSDPKTKPESDPKMKPESDPKMKPESDPKMKPESDPKTKGSDSEMTGSPNLTKENEEIGKTAHQLIPKQPDKIVSETADNKEADKKTPAPVDSSTVGSRTIATDTSKVKSTVKASMTVKQEVQTPVHSIEKPGEGLPKGKPSVLKSSTSKPDDGASFEISEDKDDDSYIPFKEPGLDKKQNAENNPKMSEDVTNPDDGGDSDNTDTYVGDKDDQELLPDQSKNNMMKSKYDDHTNAKKFEYADSHFFTYFLTVVVLCIVVYLVFHNKQKIIALIVEGRQHQRKRPNTTNYKKLDSSLEEAMQSNIKATSTSHVIF